MMQLPRPFFPFMTLFQPFLGIVLKLYLSATTTLVPILKSAASFKGWQKKYYKKNHLKIERRVYYVNPISMRHCNKTRTSFEPDRTLNIALSPYGGQISAQKPDILWKFYMIILCQECQS